VHNKHLIKNTDASDTGIRPDNPAFFIFGIPNWSAGDPVKPDTGYPANVKLV
jgi:hypothetical protein